MGVSFRLVDYSNYDHEAFVALARVADPDDTTSVRDLHDWESSQMQAGRVCQRWLAFSGEELVGSAKFQQLPWLRPSVLSVDVLVQPDRRGEGIGHALFSRLEASASSLNALTLTGGIHERDEKALRMLLAHGWSEIDRWWESRLDLTTFDPDRWTTAVEGLGGRGVEVKPLATLLEEGDSWKERLHRLYVFIESDVPTAQDIQQRSLDDFLRHVLGIHALPEGFLVALLDDEMVALTELLSVDAKHSMLAQDLTGVLPDHRGKGIAVGLKASSAIWAKEQGYKTIRTWNAQSNSAILAVNTKLGFVRGQASIEIAKEL